MREIPRRTAERLYAAAEVIAERGINDTKIEDVAAAAGIPKATLYYYFAGKEDILAFLLRDGLREIADEVEVAARADGTGVERLGGIISAQLRVMARRPAVCRALLGELSRAARMTFIVDEIATAYFKPVEAVILAGVADGSITDGVNPGNAAAALFGAVTTSAMTYLLGNDELDQASICQTMQSVIVDGLRAR